MKRTLSILAAVLVTGCAAATPPSPQVQTVVVDKGCDWTKPISVAPNDDIKTKKQVLAHDLAYQKNCPKK